MVHIAFALPAEVIDRVELIAVISEFSLPFWVHVVSAFVYM